MLIDISWRLWALIAIMYFLWIGLKYNDIEKQSFEMLSFNQEKK